MNDQELRAPFIHSFIVDEWETTSQASTPTQTVYYNTSNQTTSRLITYDAAGDVTVDMNTGNSYLYDGEGRICAVASTPMPSMTTMTGYFYDTEGRRVAKGAIRAWSCDPSANGFTTMADYVLGPNGEQSSEMSVSGGASTWSHTNVWAGGKLLATYDMTGKGLHFYLDDPLGTRRVQTDELGVIEQSCSSLPFGDGLSCTGSTTAPTEHHFTGKERDTESGNDYFGARYYSSSMGRFLSPDWSAKVAPVPYAKLDNPQTLNLYAYVGNNPLNRTDPTGHYTAGCGGDVKNCDKQIGSLDKQLQSALKSKDPNIVKAAQAYGKLGDKNGVNVTFLNVVDPKNANVTGTTGAQAGTGGITVDQATGKVQQATQVNLQAGMGGSQLQETAVHEGVHVEDRANFIGTIQMTPYSFNQNLNISGRQSEMNAYGVENEWRQGNGMPTININDQLSHPPYSTNSNIDKPILPDFPGPQ